MISLPFFLITMTIIAWGLRLVLFVLLVLFALQNTMPVSLYWFPGQAWEAPLVLVLLAFFGAGIMLGVFSLLGLVYRLRRELAKCQRMLTARTEVSHEDPPVL